MKVYSLSSRAEESPSRRSATDSSVEEGPQCPPCYQSHLAGHSYPLVLSSRDEMRIDLSVRQRMLAGTGYDPKLSAAFSHARLTLLFAAVGGRVSPQGSRQLLACEPSLTGVNFKEKKPHVMDEHCKNASLRCPSMVAHAQHKFSVSPEVVAYPR